MNNYILFYSNAYLKIQVNKGIEIVGWMHDDCLPKGWISYSLFCSGEILISFGDLFADPLSEDDSLFNVAHNPTQREHCDGHHNHFVLLLLLVISNHPGKPSRL